MPSARYWRISGVQTYSGGGLALSALHLYSGATRVDSGATLTSSHTPVAGSLAALQDADTATSCEFDGPAVRSGGFSLVFDFGSPCAVDGLRMGAASDSAGYPAALTLEYLGATWTVAMTANRCPYPGPSQMCPVISSDVGVGAVLFDPAKLGSGVSLSVGNTRADISHTGNARGNFAVASGVWQFECKVLVDTNLYSIFGIGANSVGTNDYPGSSVGNSVGIWNRTGSIFKNGAGAAYGSGYTVGDVLGCVVDCAAGTVAFYKNGSSPGAVTIGFVGPFVPMAGNGGGGSMSVGSLVYELQSALIYPVVGAQQWPFEFGVGGMLPPMSPAGRRSEAIVCASSFVAAHAAPDFGRGLMACDTEFGGPGAIYGTTKSKADPANIPLKARVRLLRQRDALLVRETWSDPVTGEWAVTGIDTRQPMIALAQDADGVYQAVAADRLVPEVAP